MKNKWNRLLPSYLVKTKSKTSMNLILLQSFYILTLMV